MNDHPFMLYQACKSPYSFYDTPIVYTLTLDNVLLFIYFFILMGGNFYLFLFLKSQTENNKALTTVDKKKERKRNFVSAKSGIICGFVLMISSFVYSIFYGLKVFTWTKYLLLLIFFAICENQLNLNCGTKALIIALYNDFIICIISPIAAVIGNPIIQNKILKKSKEISTRWIQIQPFGPNLRQVLSLADLGGRYSRG